MTVEASHANLVYNIGVVGKAVHEIERHGIERCVCENARRRYADMVREYMELRDGYETGVVNALSRYYEGVGVVEPYVNYVVSEDYMGRLRQCMGFVEAVMEHVKERAKGRAGGGQVGRVSWMVSSAVEGGGEGDEVLIERLGRLVGRFKGGRVEVVGQVEYDVCGCGATMQVFPSSSELVCPECGSVSVLHGTVFEDTQYYSQEGQRSKHGCYDPSRHCKFWVQRIQAKEKAEIPPRCIEQVVGCIRRDMVGGCRQLLCTQLRIYLKETGNTEYNDHVPLIRMLITGVAPPQLTHDETRRLYNLFDKAVNVFDAIKPTDKSNTMYYPYIIYKILEFILEEGVRKRMVLECIHLQSRDTLISNDEMWEKICGEVGGVSYRPTDRNDQVVST